MGFESNKKASGGGGGARRDEVQGAKGQRNRLMYDIFTVYTSTMLLVFVYFLPPRSTAPLLPRQGTGEIFLGVLFGKLLAEEGS